MAKTQKGSIEFIALMASLMSVVALVLAPFIKV